MKKILVIASILVMFVIGEEARAMMLAPNTNRDGSVSYIIPGAVNGLKIVPPCHKATGWLLVKLEMRDYARAIPYAFSNDPIKMSLSAILLIVLTVVVSVIIRQDWRDWRKAHLRTAAHAGGSEFLFV